MLHLKAKYVGATPGYSLRKLNPWKKAAYAATGVDWHRTALPKHFTRAGAREYDYSPRKGEPGNRYRKGFKRSYTGQKLAQFGHTLPLVYSGESRALSRLRDVRASGKGVRIVLNAPGLNRRHPKSKINMRREVLALSPADEARAMRTFDREMQRQIDQTQHTETKTLG